MKKVYQLKFFYTIGFVLWMLIITTGCIRNQDRTDQHQQTLHIIHAGSLTYPVKMISQAFQKEYPDVTILSEAWGSKAGARRIMEIETPCDIYLSADYSVIEQMLIPDHAEWYIKFAANEMAIVYTEKSKFADKINQQNWYEIMLHPDVHLARSNPDHDPCGVRTVFTAKLAELFYKKEGLAEMLLQKNLDNIRPKETDLIALLESGHVDYIFLYRSVAQQHHLSYVQLPAELNQGNPLMENWYAGVSTETLGAKPGTSIVEKGKSMVYGLTIPKKSKKRHLAENYLVFMLDSNKGMKILEDSGQPSVVPSYSPFFDQIPPSLQKFAKRQVTENQENEL
ncbi:MAG: extracellular solute-binding protein [Sphingobacteriia bacterium]|nr:extracellular solute-binding protein [Sphingobacteriia bacterium]